MRLVLAIIFGLVIFAVGFGSLRSLMPNKEAEAEAKREEALEAAKPPGRILYWCENCTAEILVVARGNGHGFRHCGEQMHKREEVVQQLS